MFDTILNFNPKTFSSIYAKTVTGSISTDFSVVTTGTIKRNRLVRKIGTGAASCTIRTEIGPILLFGSGLSRLGYRSRKL